MPELKLPWERRGDDCAADELMELGRSVFKDESDELLAASSRMGKEYIDAARMIYEARGRTVLVGIGKSGLVGRKIAATLASLGTPTLFLHAAEGIHGDLGMVCREDVGIFVSNSGSTNEILAVIPYFKRIGAKIIAITGGMDSPLANNADIVLNSHVTREADTLNLAPTNSTTVQLVIGDVLSVMVTRLRGLKKEDFALFHPGGALGRQLLTRVADVMSTGEQIPRVGENATVREALFEITQKGFGCTCVINDDGALMGIFTDGDLRRLLERDGVGAIDARVANAMTKTPKTITPDKLAAEAAHIMEDSEITALIVVDGSRPIGLVQLHELYMKGQSPLGKR